MVRPGVQHRICILLGLLSALVVVSLLLLFRDTVTKVEIAVSDFVYLADDGPQLGRFPASDQIVLVLYDDAARREMENLPTLDEDLLVYRTLLDADVKVVADTRMIADGGTDEAADVHRFLEELVAMKAQGRLYRDIWVASRLPAEFVAKVEPFIANNLLNMHPHEDSYFETRLYPLAMMFGETFRESMPLLLARSVQGVGPLSSDDVLRQFKACGIAAAWQAVLPEGVALQRDLRADNVPKSDYAVGDFRIPWHLFASKAPSVLPAGYWTSYDWSPRDFFRVSYVDVLRGVDVSRLADKIVLIGYDAAIDPSSDTYPTPSQPQRAAATEVVACALQTLLQPRLMKPVPFGYMLVTALLLCACSSVAGGSLRPIPAGIALGGLLSAWFLAMVVLYRWGWLVDLVVTPLGMVLAASLGVGYRLLREIRWRLRIVDIFGRYVPRAVVTQLVQQPDVEALALGGVQREVTVLFADIRGFTPFAERFSPEQVIEQLNSLLQVLVDCTFAYEGTVDKFIGDAILVLFNAPLDQSDHAERAARTAWAMQQGIAKHPSGLALGIGLHMGEAVVGRVGTPERMEYTAIGSTVNVASRLCNAAEGATIVVSEAVAQMLAPERFQLEPQPPLKVKGVERRLNTFLLTGVMPTEASG